MTANLELFPFPRGSGNKWDLVEQGSHTPVEKVIITTSVVKYLPSKFNKITVTLNDPKELENFQTLFSKDLEVVRFLKFNTIALKISESMKKKTESLKIGSLIKCAIKFNGVWNVAGKKHASWELVQFEELIQETKKYF